MPSLTIQEIPFASPLYESSKILRDDILRKPLQLILDDEVTQGESEQIHIAAVNENIVDGIVILKPLSQDLVKFRQVAVNPIFQGTGIGKKLITFAENHAQKTGYRKIELSARVSALGFYQKLGYETEGNEYIEDTVPSIKMTKTL